VIKTESNVVLVDVVATDKKGSYIRDLEKKDFHVFEDDAEQTVSSFSREAEAQPGAPEHRHYLVLFFDDSNLSANLQLTARQSAVKLVDCCASADQPMAVATFGRSLRLVQKFTADHQALKQAVNSIQYAAMKANAGDGAMEGGIYFSAVSGMGGDYAAHSPLAAIRQFAMSLSNVPGRKMLIVFSGGISVDAERQQELNSALSALNLANVAAYPVNMQGVDASTVGGMSIDNTYTGPSMLGTDAMSPNIAGVLRTLAKATGGFEIKDTNDPFPDLRRVAHESSEYYSLGYTAPNQTHDGSYHRIAVKVDRPGVVVRCRAGYFDTKGPDPLAGKPEGKILEERLAGQQAGGIPIALSVPYFYVAPGEARVNLALSVPGSAVEFARKDGALHSEVNVLGIAYRENGSVAARFSDKVKLNFEKQAAKEFTKRAFEYQGTFRIAPGLYTLKVALNAGGESFGTYSVPLVVEPFTGNEISLSGPALGERYAPISPAAAQMDASLMEKRTPLVFQGMELVPSPSCRFAKGTGPAVYVEIFDPVLKDGRPHRVGVEFTVADRKSGRQVLSSNGILTADHLQRGNPLVPMGFKLPVENVPPGDYQLVVQARDSEGHTSGLRSADFSIQ
jgi:Ca-activated chloride channel family protein